MSDRMVITLIGSRLARSGFEFIYRGAAGDCEGCKLKNACLNLDKHKKYRIVAVRNGLEHECALHDVSVRAVEVEACPIIVAIESRKAFNGSKIVYEMPADCDKSCAGYAGCHPQGIANGEKYTIAEVFEEPLQCEKGLNLKKVELRP